MEKLISSGKVENTAIISFHDPVGRGRRCAQHYKPIEFTGKCDRVMQIAILDLDPEALSDFGMSVETYFLEADALAEFIYKAKENGVDIICQCEYGQSRSAGCAAAILEHFESRGIDVFADYRYYPNQLVYHKVFDALEKFKGALNAKEQWYARKIRDGQNRERNHLPILFQRGDVIVNKRTGDIACVDSLPILNSHSDFGDECYYCHSLDCEITEQIILDGSAHLHIHVCDAIACDIKTLSIKQIESLKLLKEIYKFI